MHDAFAIAILTRDGEWKSYYSEPVTHDDALSAMHIAKRQPNTVRAVVVYWDERP